MTETIDRRAFVKAVGGAALAVSLAGCGGGGGGGGGDDTVDDEPNYEGWFDDVDNYDGTVDYTTESSPTVDVGAGDSGLLFGPAAIRVTTGTTVTWEWTGQGGGHNVHEENDKFSSEIANEQGHTFEHTFEESGTFRYYCEPHRAQGMKGAVDVVEE